MKWLGVVGLGVDRQGRSIFGVNSRTKRKKNMPTQEQLAMDEAIKVAAMYLLYDKENETSLRVAFAALAQERHNHFHTKREKNEDCEVDFPECKNDICQAAFKILQEAREPAVEFTPLSLELIDNYTMKVEKTQNICRVELVKKSSVAPATLKEGSVKLTV